MANWQAFQQNIGGIGSALGKRAKEDRLRKEKAHDEFQQKIEIATAIEDIKHKHAIKENELGLKNLQKSVSTIMENQGQPHQPQQGGQAYQTQKPDYGTRTDGSQKGRGFLGELNRPDGGVSTEISVGVEFDGKETEIPTLVPTLTEKERNHLLSGGHPTKEIVDKAIAHAKQRISQGQSPFAQESEQKTQGFSQGFGQIPQQEQRRGLPPQFQTVPEVSVTSDGKTRVNFKQVEREDFKLAVKEKESKIKIKGKIADELQKKQSNFNQAISMFKGIVSQVKGASEEQGGLGILPGMKGAIMSNIPGQKGKFSRRASAYGQKVETAARLNSILTGQNRVIKSVLNMIFKSLPDWNDPDEVVASKIAQSVSNAYKVTKAFEKSGLTPEVLKGMGDAVETLDVESLIAQSSLTKQEKAELERIIQDVLASSIAKKRTLGGNQFEGQAPKKSVEDLGFDPSRFEIIGVE